MKKLLALVPVLLGLVIYYSMNTQKQETASKDLGIQNKVAQKEANTPSSIKERVTSEPSALKPVATPQPEEPKTRIEDKGFARYEILKEKVLRSAEEEKELSHLLADPKFALKFKPLFALGADQSQQFKAIDFIFEQEKISTATKDLLKSVLSDSRIENSSLPLPQRQELAGLSAELAYRWIVKDPSITPEIQESLSGPVGRKILAGVQEQIKKNEIESRIAEGDDPGQL